MLTSLGRRRQLCVFIWVSSALPTLCCSPCVGTVPPAPAPAKVVGTLSDGLLVQFRPPTANNGADVVEHEVRVAVVDADSDDDTQVRVRGLGLSRAQGALLYNIGWGCCLVDE
jgi:hypothetical protein